MSVCEDDERRLWFRRKVLPLEALLLAYARRFCRRGENEAEDLVHETFARLIAHENWRKVRDPAPFAARVLKNIALDALRRRKVVSIEAIADFDSLTDTDENPGPEAVAIAGDELSRLKSLIEQLPSQCRRVFTLRKVYELTHEEIAEQLGISVSTVEKHVVKGLRLCSEGLARQAGPSNGSDKGRIWGRTRDQGRKT